MYQYCKKIKDSLDNNNIDKQEEPVRIMRLWEDTWEQKKVGPWGDPILEAKLTAKYQGLKFYNIDSEDNMALTEHRMVFWKERAKNRYDAFGIMPGFNRDLLDDSAQNDTYWQPWEVNKDLFDCIRAYYQDAMTEPIKTYDLGEGCESDTE